MSQSHQVMYSDNTKLFNDEDLNQFMAGTHRALYRFLGAHPTEELVRGELCLGVRFTVWAPNASRVAVIGEFNGWDGRSTILAKVQKTDGTYTGLWSIFTSEALVGQLYQFQLHDAHGHILPHKADPVAFSAELAPGRASRICAPLNYEWSDHGWMSGRQSRHDLTQAMSIYEVHLGSWSRHGRVGYREVAQELIPYVKALGFTHIELMPITEFPFDGSWGYQTLGLFAPTSRYGSPEDLCDFIDQCHQADIGVFLDWVPGHFPLDDHGLVRFDGTALYEHEDQRRGLHPDWGTALYQYGRYEVKDFLVSSALFWLDRFHFDGIRVDAVASMLYLDYSRSEGEWVPNQFGGNEHLEAVDFIKLLNEEAYSRHPGVVMIAEESTSWPGVSEPTYNGGLGFGRKWNMGWMNDTLRYIEQDPIYRQYNGNLLTFGLVYQYSERFILPISHDEVVHGKKSLLRKMPGDEWQCFANLRSYLCFMWTHPGQKLLFMGAELSQDEEWSPDHGLNWHQLDEDIVDTGDNSQWSWTELLDRSFKERSVIEELGISHDKRRLGVWLLLRRLNSLYRQHTALHQQDMEPAGFEWILYTDSDRSVFSFKRIDQFGKSIVVVLNFTPVPRYGERVGVPSAASDEWVVLLNSDEGCYGGSGVGPQTGHCLATEVAWQGQDHSIILDLPPLAAVILTQSENT